MAPKAERGGFAVDQLDPTTEGRIAASERAVWVLLFRLHRGADEYSIADILRGAAEDAEKSLQEMDQPEAGNHASNLLNHIASSLEAPIINSTDS